jgi:putative Mn2+ efflux pump MntP
LFVVPIIYILFHSNCGLLGENRIGWHFGKRAEVVGVLILILIGMRIVLTRVLV